MTPRFLTLLGVLFWLTGLCLAQDIKVYWVLADFGLVRAEPKSGANVIGGLVTGTRLSVAKTSEDWLYVDSVHETFMGGWIHASIVSDTAVNEKFLLKHYAQSLSTEDSLKWMGRLVSLRPQNHKYMQALQRIYVAVGDTAQASYWGTRIRGTDPIYLARFEDDDCLVIGFIDSAGEFHNLLWDGQSGSEWMVAQGDSSAAILKMARDLRVPLASRKWYGIHKSDSSGTYFFKPTISMGNDFNTVDGMTFGISLGSAQDVYSRTYGKTILATRPMCEVPVQGLKSKVEFDSLPWFEKKLVGKAFDSTGLRGIRFQNLVEYGYLDMTLQGGVTPNGMITSDWEQRGVFNAKRQLVWPSKDIGGNNVFDLESPQVQRVHIPANWFRFGPNASYPAFIILPFSTDSPGNFKLGVSDENRVGQFGVHLLRVDKKGFKQFSIRLHNAGC